MMLSLLIHVRRALAAVRHSDVHNQCMPRLDSPITISEAATEYGSSGSAGPAVPRQSSLLPLAGAAVCQHHHVDEEMTDPQHHQPKQVSLVAEQAYLLS
jgi:hypothetical protein